MRQPETYLTAENTTIKTGAARFTIKPKLIATGTAAKPPDCWITGRVKSKLVAPPTPTAALGNRRIMIGINSSANSSRSKSFNSATLPHSAPYALVMTMPESEYQP